MRPRDQGETPPGAGGVRAGVHLVPAAQTLKNSVELNGITVATCQAWRAVSGPQTAHSGAMVHWAARSPRSGALHLCPPALPPSQGHAASVMAPYSCTAAGLRQPSLAHEG